MNIFEATKLQTMYQELLPFGISPQEVFYNNKAFLDRISEDKSGITLDHNYDVVVNPPEFDKKLGALFVSIHFDNFFSCLPSYIARQIAVDKELTILMSRHARETVPKWKNDQYKLLEDTFGINLIYAEDKNCLMDAARRLRKGEIVFTYIDAIVPGAAKNRTLDARLLDSKIKIPSGAIEVALSVNANVIPVISNSSTLGSSISFGSSYRKPLEPQQVINEITEYFGRVILTAPHKWTQWDFLAGYTNREYPNDVFGLKEFESEVVEHENGEYIFNYCSGLVEEVKEIEEVRECI